MKKQAVGLGDRCYHIAVCIANRPDMPEYQWLSDIEPLQNGEVARIVEATGNHWRKILNIYAKLMFLLDAKEQSTWQTYRDRWLLQSGSGHALIFSTTLPPSAENGVVYIVSGKQHAQTLGVLDSAIDLCEGFYLEPAKNLVITPYFDYRQLSNRKLDMLISIINNDMSARAPTGSDLQPI